jgi:hypothetical protein
MAFVVGEGAEWLLFMIGAKYSGGSKHADVSTFVLWILHQ